MKVITDDNINEFITEEELIELNKDMTNEELINLYKIVTWELARRGIKINHEYCGFKD